MNTTFPAPRAPRVAPPLDASLDELWRTVLDARRALQAAAAAGVPARELAKLGSMTDDAARRYYRTQGRSTL